MAKFRGTRNSAAAIFIYKDEGIRNDSLWNDSLKSVSEKEPIHVELITKRDDFLNNLSAWNKALEFISEDSAVMDNHYTSGILLINAHMNQQGISPVQQRDSRFISWKDVVDCIPKPISLVWLFGCKSDCTKDHWRNRSEYLLTCVTEESFVTAIPVFKKEISMDPIIPFRSMINELREKIPSLAYFRDNGSGWTKSFEH